jgi:MurNAc alpha-1-phosphate uridylyltransferase
VIGAVIGAVSDRLCAVVLAAGYGTRLRPLTDRVPKALCPVGERPILDHALDLVGELGL